MEATMSLDAMIDVLGTEEFAARSHQEQADYLLEVYRRFKREFPGDEQLGMLGVLVARFIQQAREETQAQARLN